VIETTHGTASPVCEDLEQSKTDPKAETRCEVNVGLLTGGFDRPYAIGLATALASKGVLVEVIGSDQMDSPELHAATKVAFRNLQGNKQPNTRLAQRVVRVLIYYARLMCYTASPQPKLFHILWNNEFQFFDRTVLMVYYKIFGKKIVLTAHNVNAGKRDCNDSLLNRLTLRMQYSLSDHIFVHTNKMKRELIEDFGVGERATSVIPFGINNTVPHTDLSPREAKQRLNIKDDERTILFFGAIRPYKGLAYLTRAFRRLAIKDKQYRLIIAGNPKKGCEQYIARIQQEISHEARVVQKIQFIPDDEIELYFKAADVVALPYTHVFQSGVLFLAYSFGLPVVATDVGSFREDVIEGRTGFLCKSCDPVDLANAIEKYFESGLFRTLDSQRRHIREYANKTYSWDLVSDITRTIYSELLEGKR
jgi:glycosyltransferase involved in cell wall biosynthesis